MKNKIAFKALACLLALFLLTPVLAVFADSEDGASAVCDRITLQKMKEQKAKDTQELIDGYLSSSAGIISEWYIIALSHENGYDFSTYEAALHKYISENKVSSAATRQKYALALLSIGSKSDYITQTLESTVGEQGIMSYVFGLHLLTNGQTDTKITKEAVILKLLELEVEGGGWALTGENADVDVSAMVIQALAPYYSEYSSVKEKVDRALNVLSQKQQSDGDFLSYGVANPESPAQMIIALSSLGIDFESDERFIKNGNTLLDGVKKYQLESGAFCHQIGKGANENATSQVFLAMRAYLDFKNGGSPIFIFDRKNEDLPISPDTTTDRIETTQKPQTADTEKDTDEAPKNGKKMPYKPIACAMIVLVCAVIFVVLFATKRANIKNLAALLIVGAILTALVLFLDIQAPKDYYSGEAPTKKDPVGVVKMSIRCDVIADKVQSSVILEETDFEIEKGDTVYKILIEAAKKHGILIENNGNDKMAYIVGINGIYEMDHGDLSGWIYTVNGESVSVGCSDCELKDGDVVVWEYTLELGKIEQD